MNSKVKTRRNSGSSGSGGLGILWLFAILYPFVMYLDILLKMLGLSAIIILSLKGLYMFKYRKSNRKNI